MVTSTSRDHLHPRYFEDKRLGKIEEVKIGDSLVPDPKLYDSKNSKKTLKNNSRQVR